MEVQFLARARNGPLPDITHLQAALETYGPSDTRNTEDGLLTTIRWQRTLPGRVIRYHIQDVWTVLEKKLNREVLLVLPDVYGCPLSVSEHYVEVNVGRDVIRRITRDQQLRTGFNKTMIRSGDTLYVNYISTGRFVVMFLHSDHNVTSWVRMYPVILRLITMLKPFQAFLPGTPTCVRDRCINRHGIGRVPDLPLPDLDDCQIDAFICVSNEICAQNISLLSRMMRTMYPGLQLVRAGNTFTLVFSGVAQADVVKKADSVLNYMKSLSQASIPVTDTQATMMNKADAQEWFQQILDSREVVCVWKLQQVSTDNRYRSTPTLDSGQALSVLASASDVQNFTHLFQFYVQTTVIHLGGSKVPLLESHTWKLFLGDLQKPIRGRISPVLKVQEGKISICDVESNIDNTRRAVHNFFLAEMGTRQLDLESRKRQQEDKKLQTGDTRARTAAGQQQTDDPPNQDREQQTDVIQTDDPPNQDREQQTDVIQTDDPTNRDREQQSDVIPIEDKEAQPEVTDEAKKVQTEESTVTTDEKETQTCGRRQHNKEQQTTQTQLQTREAQTQTEACTTHRNSKEQQKHHCRQHRHRRGQRPVLHPSTRNNGRDGAQTQTELQEQQTGVSDRSEPDNTPEEDTSFTCPKSVVSTQKYRITSDVGSQPAAEASHGYTASLSSSDSLSSEESKNLNEVQHITKENIANTNSAITRPDRQDILYPRSITKKAFDSATLSDCSSVNSVRSSTSSLTLEKERMGAMEQIIPQSDTGTFSFVPPPRIRRSHSFHDLATQQPGSSRGPPTRVAPAPHVLERHTESGMNNTLHVPRADVSAERPQRVRHCGDPSQRDTGSATVYHVSDSSAGIYGHNRGPSAEGGTACRFCPQTQSYCHDGRPLPQSAHAAETPQDDLAGFTTPEEHQRHHRSSQQSNNTTCTDATIGNNDNNDNYNLYHLFRDLAILGTQAHHEMRCSPTDRERVHVFLQQMAILGTQAHNEMRYSPTDRELVHEPAVLLENRMIQMQHQLDQMQGQNYRHPQQNDNDSIVGFIGNPSATGSASSASSFITSEQNQRPPTTAVAAATTTTTTTTAAAATTTLLNFSTGSTTVTLM